MQTSPVLLKVTQLSLAIGSQSILKQLNFQVLKGQTVALVGESGSGKSMTAQTILRLLPNGSQVTDGHIEFNGQSLLGIKESAMQQLRGKSIGMIFQEPNMSLNPVLTIGRQVAESLKIHTRLSQTQIQQRVIELLHEVQLPNPDQRLSWYPHQLSGGQKQRVMIAIALACEPELLIADEPTTALDVTIQAQILDLLKTIQQQRQLSILLITHDMGIVAQMADEVVVMKSGEIVEAAPKPVFFDQPQHPYSQHLLQSIPNMQRFREQRTQVQSLLSVNQLDVRFAIKKGLLRRTSGYVNAAQSIQFEVKKGETLAIVGESGSGKSTIGKALLRLLDDQAQISGGIEFNGYHLEQLSQKQLRTLRHQFQIVFQDPYSSLNPRFTIEQTLSEGMLALNVVSDRQQLANRCRQLMIQVGLEESMLHRYPNEFSGGQRQRIAIARCLAVNPSLIVCDEPTSALDVSLRQTILQLLIELQKQHQLALIFITHDLSLIPHIAHRVAVMNQGQIVEVGEAQQILLNPQHEYTKKLIDAIPALVWSKNAISA